MRLTVRVSVTWNTPCGVGAEVGASPESTAALLAPSQVDMQSLRRDILFILGVHTWDQWLVAACAHYKFIVVRELFETNLMTADQPDSAYQHAFGNLVDLSF